MADVDTRRVSDSGTISPPWHRWDLSVSSAIVVMATVAFGALYLREGGSPEFWWDEAGQYWMSLGQYHLSDAGTPAGSVIDGLYQGRNGWNLDPVGFTILLRGWIEVFGASPMALRALPFVAYVLTFLVGAALGRVMRLPWFVSLAVSLSVISSAVVSQFATELRAYSLELLGVGVTATLTICVVVGSRRAGVALPVAFLFFTIFSRYSFVVAVGASCTTLAFATVMVRSRRLATALAAAAVGAFLSAAFVLWNVGAFGGARQASPGYTDRLELAGPEAPTILLGTLRENFATGSQILVGLFLLTSGVVLVAGWLRRRTEPADAGELRGSPVLRPWHGALLFVVSYEVLAAALSVLGLAPWNAAYRWSIGLYGVALVAGLGLLSQLFEVLPAWSSQAPTTTARRRQSALLALAIAASLLLALGASLRIVRFDRTYYQQLGPTLAELPARDRTLVAVDYWPLYRMLAEPEGSVPADTVLLGRNPAGQQGPGLEPVMFAGDADYLATLPADGGCSPGQTSVILLPQSPDLVAGTIRELRLTGRGGGCQVDIRQGPDGGTVAIVRG